MKSFLKGLALVVMGYLLACYFQFTFNLNYTHVYQTQTSANQRQITFSLQPYREVPPINLFGKN